jgi:molybdenum cofactor sulfurtransferase
MWLDRWIRKKSNGTGERFARFLKDFPRYSETLKFDELRASQFARLDERGEVYLDYTGGNLYAQSQLDAHQELLQKEVLGNPHSGNPTSQRSTRLVEETRAAVLRYFGGEDDYFCVFTANASGALKIVGESFPFEPGGKLLLTFDNHNSVNGIREFARSKGADFSYIPMLIEDLRIDEAEVLRRLEAEKTERPKLFAFPGQSNVSGVKHPLSLIEEAQKRSWYVLLDAAAFVPSNRLDLKRVKPDFVSLSFYKMFGYPTGIGALLIRRSSFGILKKPWFAGGTVQIASVMGDGFFLHENHEKFEDGTLDYLSIPAVGIGLRQLEQLGVETLAQRLECLTLWLIRELEGLRHSNGAPAVRVFGPRTAESRGATVLLNFVDAQGVTIPFETIEAEANRLKISIRTGCFCNPGLDEINHCLDSESLSRYFATREKGSQRDMIGFLGKLRGAIRISLGMASNFSDIEAFLAFARTQLR